MKVYVTGASGVIGRALREFLPQGVFLDRYALDVTDTARFDIQMRTAVVNNGPPSAIIHAAAVTDHATPDIRRLIDVNVCGTARVASWAGAHGVPLVFLSTHYVYPGIRGRYREGDALQPIGAYAMSKFAGEQWARSVPNALVIRGSWYTPESRLDAWANTGAFNDAWVSRESSRDAARKIAALTLAERWGVFNIGGPRRTFAQILRDEGYTDFPEGSRRFATSTYPFPEDVSVDTGKFDRWERAQAAPPAQLSLALEAAEPAATH